MRNLPYAPIGFALAVMLLPHRLNLMAGTGLTAVSVSFDHLVGAGEDRLRHGEAERLCGLQVDDQLEFRRLLDWQIGRIGAVEDLSDIDAGLAIGPVKLGP